METRSCRTVTSNSESIDAAATSRNRKDVLTVLEWRKKIVERCEVVVTTTPCIGRCAYANIL